MMYDSAPLFCRQDYANPRFTAFPPFLCCRFVVFFKSPPIGSIESECIYCNNYMLESVQERFVKFGHIDHVANYFKK